MPRAFTRDDIPFHHHKKCEYCGVKMWESVQGPVDHDRGRRGRRKWTTKEEQALVRGWRYGAGICCSVECMNAEIERRVLLLHGETVTIKEMAELFGTDPTTVFAAVHDAVVRAYDESWGGPLRLPWRIAVTSGDIMNAMRVARNREATVAPEGLRDMRAVAEREAFAGGRQHAS